LSELCARVFLTLVFALSLLGSQVEPFHACAFGFLVFRAHTFASPVSFCAGVGINNIHSKEMTAKTGQPGQDSQDRPAGTRQAEKYIQNRTSRTGQAEQDRQNRIDRTGQAYRTIEQDYRDRNASQGSQNSTARTKLPVRYHCGGWSEEVNSCILIS
jgi:hypothetical protein